MTDLEIHLLGHFEVVVDGTPVGEQRWSRKKSKVLVKLLALAPNHKMHREQLIDILWPDTDPGDALNNFHKIVHATRRSLEPALTQGGASRFLLTQDLQVVLTGSAMEVDVEKFDSLAADALQTADTRALESALAVYRGDLLEEDIYEDWASVARERLRLVHQRVLERLAGNFESARDERAIAILNRLLAINRANEDAHRRLMRLYRAMGQRHLALNQYRACCDALKLELDATPEPETVQLYESLLAGEAVTAAAPMAELPSVQPPVPLPADPPRKMRPPAASWVAIVAIAVVLTAAVTASILRRTPDRGVVPSLAILPLRTQVTGGPLESVADGISEELINSISRLNGIRVMARGTAFAYKGRFDAREVGRELKVTTVAFGYVRQEDTTATVGLELIDVADGARIWARKYSVPAQNLTGLQQLLASDLAAALQLKLTGSQREQQARRSTDNPEAYRLYLTGRFFWNQRTPEGFRKSIEYYQQAIDRDANYALAHAGLADSYGLLGWESGLPRDYFPKARAAAVKALELDESLAEAQTSLAMVSALYEWNWIAAEAQFRRAIELNSGYATAHHWYGVHLGAMKQFDHAQRELTAALDLDPLSPIVNLNYGYPAFYQRRFREAIDIFGKALALNPDFAPAYDNRMTAYALKNDQSSAVKDAVQLLRVSGPAELAATVERAAATGGYRAALQSWLEALERRQEQEFVSPMSLARLAVALGDRDRSFRWLDRAYQQRSPQLVYIAADPRYDALRSDARFQDLLRRVGLPLQ